MALVAAVHVLVAAAAVVIAFALGRAGRPSLLRTDLELAEAAAREGAAMPWRLDAQANATGLFKSMAPTSFFPPSQNLSAVNAFFPAAGVVGNAQEREEEQAEAEEAQRELEIDPNQAIYKADQVDVKTGEEQEQTLFTLDKAKLFEYQKADDDAAVMDYRTQNQPLSSSFPFN